MYLRNKYTNWYNSIIKSAARRGFTSRKHANSILGYSEKHHIVPVSLGGDNSKSNLVYLTAKEHYVCHHLLMYMTDGRNRYKMIKAAHRMLSSNKFQSRTKITARFYEYIRPLLAEAISKSNAGLLVGEKNGFFGKTHSNETKKKIGTAIRESRRLSPRTTSDETKQKISNALAGKKRSEHTRLAIKQSWERTREQRSGENCSLSGVPKSDSAKSKMREAAKRRWTDEYKEQFKQIIKETRPKFTCPHCGKCVTGSWNLKQHTERCLSSTR